MGGCIATNGLGYTAAGYGSMGSQVLGLEVVLPTRNVLITRHAENSSTGPNLTQLFIGSEGALGVITKAVLRAYPLPEKRLLMCYEYEDFGKGFKVVLDLYLSSIIPTALEYGEILDQPADPS